jgi:hypothetical protein
MRPLLLELAYNGGEVSLPVATAAAYNLIRIPKILALRTARRKRRPVSAAQRLPSSWRGK